MVGYVPHCTIGGICNLFALRHCGIVRTVPIVEVLVVVVVRCKSLLCVHGTLFATATLILGRGARTTRRRRMELMRVRVSTISFTKTTTTTTTSSDTKSNTTNGSLERKYVWMQKRPCGGYASPSPCEEDVENGTSSNPTTIYVSSHMVGVVSSVQLDPTRTQPTLIRPIDNETS